MKSSTAALALCLSVAVPVVAKERAEISVPYRIAPSKPLPPGLEAVAVIDAAVRADESDAARREQKWSSLAADMIESMLINADAGADSPPLQVVDRRNMAAVLKEHDLVAAGIVGAETAHQLGELLAVQGLIVSRIQIDLTQEAHTSHATDWGQILTGIASGGSFTPGGGNRMPGKRRMYGRTSGGGASPVFDDDEVTEISRNLTVRCSFRLLDAVTGRALSAYDPPPFRKTDTTSPVFMFGTVIHEEELNPVDHFIGELVEKAAQEFVGQLVPVTGETKVTVVGRGKNGEAGIRALRRGDAESARQLFKQAIIDDPDDHENIFALGVAFELLDRPENALYCYRRAAGHPRADEEEAAAYMAARDRVAAYLDGIEPDENEPDSAAGEPDDSAPSTEPANDADDADSGATAPAESQEGNDGD